MNKKEIRKGVVPYAVLIVVMLLIIYFFNVLNVKVNNLTYDKFVSALNNNEVKELTILPSIDGGVYTITGALKDYKTNETFKVVVPLSDEVVKKITSANEKYEFSVNTESDPNGSLWLVAIVNFLPIIIIGGFMFYILTRQIGGNNKSFDFGKSRAKLDDSQKKVTFEAVAGLKEEKEELKELIDFLKNPKKFTKLGARIPKGVLLVGPPGTGKTLLARAVAGEANVPFYYISGSDFVELFVGVGASRVRDMFRQAKHNAPCLIFIDEIDAVGRQRGTGLGGGHDEREQTLNQLLTEMDGFGANE